MSEPVGTEPAAAVHARQLIVWDVPAAIRSADTFRIHVGVRCDLGCRPAGWRLEVRDHAGRLVAREAPATEAWPGTDALFASVIELEAPREAGRYDWRVSIAETVGESADMPGHGAAGARFAVRVVPEADCRLSVIVTERETGRPLAGARVVAHPYRAVTDASGVAGLDLPQDSYRLFVSANGFLTARFDSELDGDVTIRAELERDVGPSDAEIWP